MYIEEVTIQNETGLHARPAGNLVKLCQGFQSDIFLKREEMVINAKSVLKVLSAGLTKGTQITLEAIGEDEEEAGRVVAEYIRNLKE